MRIHGEGAKGRTFFVFVFLMFTWVAESYAAMEVFVSIAPQKWLVEAVGREQVNVSILVNASQDPHVFEPTPRQVAALARSKIWFLQGMEFETQLARKVRQVAPGLLIVDMSRQVEKVPITWSKSEGREAQHTDQQGHAEEEHHHGAGQLDPHVWLSPRRLQVMSMTVAQALSEADPANTGSYGRNRLAVQRELTALDEDIARMLEPWKGSSFFVYHPAFGYFARDYDLVQQPVEVGGKSPGPRQLAGLIATARKENVKVIFVQPQFDRKSAQAVAAAIEGEVVPLDDLAENVPDNLRIMAKKIEAALKK